MVQSSGVWSSRQGPETWHGRGSHVGTGHYAETYVESPKSSEKYEFSKQIKQS